MLTKSKYCNYCQCKKMLWLKINKPEELEVDESALARVEGANKVCALEKTMFGDFVDVHKCCGAKADTNKLASKTTELISAGEQLISGATFVWNDCACTVDLLKKENDGYAMFELKSSTSAFHHTYIVGIAFQKFVLEQCGVKVVSTNVVNVNNKYVFDKKLDLTQLFKVSNVDELVEKEIVNVEKNIIAAQKILTKKAEPKLDLCASCHSPYACGYWKYCSKHLPTPSVFDLYATSIQKKIAYYNKGIVSFQDLLNTGENLGHIQNMQVFHTLKNLPTNIDKPGIKKFLNTLSYPLYFLDFETVQSGIPTYKKSKPYQPIPFQYSLHYVEHKGGEVKHKEFFADSLKDPRKQIAKRLCKDIPLNACVLAYNKFFERDRIRELAKLYPRLGKKLNVIADNVKDLAVPFLNGSVYNKLMGNSISIKSILPALYPNDPSLNYDNLQGVHNGNEAMIIYPKMKSMTKAERKKVKQELLEYCKLDTFAMVKIYEFLVKSASK